MRGVFFDRDGTINVDKGYTNKLEDLIIYPGADEMWKLKARGFFIFVVSNQGGVGKYYEEEDILKFNKEISLILGNVIDVFRFCPHRSEDNCNCRKPKTAMIDDIIQKFKISANLSFLIGDKSSDISSGKNKNMTTILVLTGHGKEEFEKTYPDYVVKDIRSAINLILEKTKSEIKNVYGENENGERLCGVIDFKLEKGYVKRKTKMLKILDYEFEVNFEVLPFLPVDFIIPSSFFKQDIPLLKMVA